MNEQYRTGFRSHASTLRDLESTGSMDTVLGGGRKSGYDFLYTGGEDKWFCRGNPTTPGATGSRYFFVDPTGVIRFSSTGPANTAHRIAERPRRGGGEALRRGSPSCWTSPASSRSWRRR